MYRYGDGTPFPLDENFIETLTTAVETCTNAFVPLGDLDGRRTRALDTKREAEVERTRLTELEQMVASSLATFLAPDKKTSVTQAVAQKLVAAAKTTIAEAKRQIDSRVVLVDSQAAGKTVSDAVIKALRPFFDQHQLPKTQWIMSWDVRGAQPHADAIATAGPLSAAFELAPDPYRQPIRVEQLAERVVVHMMKKGVFGKAKPAPVDLGKYVVVQFERTATNNLVVTLKENPNKSSSGLRFNVGAGGATWVTISATGDSEGEDNELDMEDVPPVRSLADRAAAALKDLLQRRTLVDLTLNGKSISDIPEPRSVPLELLAQLTPLARTIRDKSRMSGELVLKRDIGDGRREELFVPRATLAQQFTRLPYEYRRPFEDMGITSEETSPSIQLPLRPPARTKTDVDLDDDDVEEMTSFAPKKP